MLPALSIHVLEASPEVRESATAPFVPTYLLPYAPHGTIHYRHPDFGAVLQQYDAFDVYIVVLEVKTRQTDVSLPAFPFETLQHDLHWVYLLKGTATIRALSHLQPAAIELAEGRQLQVYSPPTTGNLHLTERHTLLVSIAAKGKWLTRHIETGGSGVEMLIGFLRKRSQRCVASHHTPIGSAVHHLAELLTLAPLEGELLDAAIALPVSALIRMVRRQSVEPEQQTPLLISSIQRQIDHLLQNDLIPTVTDLASKNGLGARWLGQQYHALSGQTLQAYIAQRRLDEAYRLLVEEKLSISEVSFKMGYAEVSVFSRLFKRRYGQSPRAYLQSLRS